MPETLIDPAEVADTVAAQAAVQAAAVAASSDAAATTSTGTADTTPGAAAAVVSVVVPETYDLKLPAGSTVDPAIVERTAAIARELGLSNEAGQKLLDETAKDLAAQLAAREVAVKEAAKTEFEAQAQAAHATLVESWKNGGTEFVKRDEQWRAQALADPDIAAGDPGKLTVAIEKAQLALTKYGPELKTYLDETGLGSHPAAIKFLAKIGRAMDESGLVLGASGGNGAAKSAAQVMYPSHYNEDGSPKT